MSNFDETFILLKEEQKPLPFITNLNKKLKTIHVLLQKSDYELVAFNDTRDEEEKEPIWLDESMTDEEVIDLICSWKGLGMLTYRNPDFLFDIGVAFMTWNDEHIQGIMISFAEKDTVFEREVKHRELIVKISQFLDCEYVVGDIGNTSRSYISMEESLDKIKEHISKSSFTIDSRSW
ncbi:hypothetical protein [Chryseobacterium sp. Mn2064]|uniref:hypothetical protein n=1 Tax=Chryseobacterium sp. Mn2064 TaxID=3395263 RepID=UPI003BBAAC94